MISLRDKFIIAPGPAAFLGAVIIIGAGVQGFCDGHLRTVAGMLQMMAVGVMIAPTAAIWEPTHEPASADAPASGQQAAPPAGE